MDSMITKIIETPYGKKFLSVCCGDITGIDVPVDILTVSAFYKAYYPTPRTVIGALYEKGISVAELSKSPEIDLRSACNIWLSGRLRFPRLPLERIGCIEMSPYRYDRSEIPLHEADIVSSVQAYFRMLDIASLSGMDVNTVVMPVIGSGRQGIDTELTATPILSECFRFLKQNPKAKEIKIIDINQAKAYKFAQILDRSYLLKKDADTAESSGGASSRRAFISYSSKDKNVADNLCAKLEAAGIKVWYSPRDTAASGISDYASAIVKAISECTDFAVIISANSLKSNHVLNEIDLAFQETNHRKLNFRPLRLDEEKLGDAFKYYLSRQHWMDARCPPLEDRLDEFVASFFASDASE